MHWLREMYLPDLTIILLNYAFDLARLVTLEGCLPVRHSSFSTAVPTSCSRAQQPAQGLREPDYQNGQAAPSLRFAFW